MADLLAVLVCVWLHAAAARATAADVPSCLPRTGRQQMVVVKAPVPYFSWQQCNDLFNAGKGYQTEPINATKHAGVVKLL